MLFPRRAAEGGGVRGRGLRVRGVRARGAGAGGVARLAGRARRPPARRRRAARAPAAEVRTARCPASCAAYQQYCLLEPRIRLVF